MTENALLQHLFMQMLCREMIPILDIAILELSAVCANAGTQVHCPNRRHGSAKDKRVPERAA